MPEVVIAGAGPAGASLAYLLARRGISVTLLERHVDFAREFRGEVLMPSGEDAVRQMGLGTELDALPQIRITAIEIYRGARRMLRLSPAQIGLTGPRVISQPAFLEMLVGASAASPSFGLERGTTVRDLLWVGGRVAGVRVESASGAREITASLVIGADGRSSLLRRRAGLHEERMPQAFDIVWAKLPLPDFLAEAPTARAYLGRGHAALCFPSYDGRLQIAWVINKGSFGDLRRYGVEAWVDEMANHVSEDLAAHLRASRDAITHPFLLDVVSDRLVRWTAPGLLLLGDAAHPMSPVGGQGINIALRDVLVAANHLCPVLQAGTEPAAVDAAARRVVAERLPEVTTIQRLQQRPPRVLFGHQWWRPALLALLPLLARSGLAAGAFASVFRRFASGITPVKLEV